ncbi:MAG: hypothetical protein HQK78_19600 [Desulfobacterales bacterium]|nr:hypothetical protein [Desulfobacterales bacterium]
MLYQQGNVLIESIQSIPTEALVKNPENNKYIIAKGEATGHAHVIKDPVVLYCHKKTFYILAKIEFQIIHEEHLPLFIPKGIYQIRKVREYDHFFEETKEIAD